MVGVVWFVHVIHYPLFEKVGTGKFALYSKSHSRLTDYVVSHRCSPEEQLSSSSFAGPRACT